MGGHRSRRGDVIVLDERGVTQSHTMIDAPATTHRVLLQRTQSRQRLTGVPDLSRGARHRFHPGRRGGGDARQVRGEVEGGALGDQLRLDAGRDLYVGGRVGYVISPLAMIYAKGGYTNARIESRYTAGTTEFRDHTNLDGFRVGAGLEYNITPTAYVKGEYRYSHYGDVDGYNIDLDRHQLLGGVGIRF